MKLSIIVPVYNVEKYLEQCVDSLLAQTVREKEIILVDDGSKDSSGKIADLYASRFPGIVQCLHLENGGQGRARNHGLRLAHGEYVGFVDSDDWIDPEMYRKMIEKAEETGADLVFCDFLEHYADGRENYLPAAFQDHPLSSAGSSCNKIFKRALIGSLTFPEGLWYEDFFFSAVMLTRASKMEYLREPLYHYRIAQNSTMHNDNAVKNLDILQIMDLLEKELTAIGREEDFRFFLINHVLLDTINRLSSQHSSESRNVIRRFQRYAHEKIPDLAACPSFRAEVRNRRIIMYLNYHGLAGLSRMILNLKAATK